MNNPDVPRPPKAVLSLTHLAGLVALALFLGVCPLGTRTARGQSDNNATATASLTDSSVEAGETTRFQISVDNGTADRPPNPPVIEGLNISYIGPSQQYAINIINGKFARRVTVTYSYNVRTSRPGKFTFPEQEVSVGGSTLRTTPVTLNVEDAGAPQATPPGQKLSAELVIDKKTAYVGESFPAELRAYFGLDVNVLAFAEEPVLSGEGFSVQKFTRARLGVTTLEGLRYRSATYRTVVTGVKTGTVSIGPVDTMPVVQMLSKPSRKQRQRGGGGVFGDEDDDFPFANLFGNSGRLSPPQQTKVTAPPAQVEILPLPPGQPEGFSGGIGQFKLEAEVEPRRAHAGDPITVRLVLTGLGNFTRINAPTLTDEKGLRTYPATSQFKADDDLGLSGTKTFEQVVIADGARTSLPPYHFDYLDPDTGKYVPLDTAPIPVQIEGSAVPPPTATPALTDVNSPAPTPTATPAPPPAKDILYIRTDLGKREGRSAFLPVYRTRSFWLAQGVPLVALLAAGGWLAWRARSRNEAAQRLSAIHRQQGELQRALRQETTSRRDFYTAATRLAQLRTASGQTASLTAAEIVRTRGLDDQTTSGLQEIFHRHDELAYSGGQAAQAPVPAEERQQVLATLETLGRSRR